MFMSSPNVLRPRPVVLVLLVAVASTTCGKGGPTAPGSAPPPPPNRGSVLVTIKPNPVPFSGVPVTDTPECATLKETWYYDQIFKETGGTSITFTARVDTFDGFVVNNFSGLNIQIQPLGSLTLHARWCSGNPIQHVAQSTFTGVDGNGSPVSLTTDQITLLAP
jgi:hypothetical protein